MKIFNIILPIASLFIILLSCGVTESPLVSRTYSIENSTNFSVNIKFYFAVNDSLVLSSSLPAGAKFQGDELVARSPIPTDSDYDGPRISAFNLSDSTVILFDNSKKIVQQSFVTEGIRNYSQPLDRNIFRHGSYEDIGNDEFLFTITQEDFERAEDCGGPCE